MLAARLDSGRPARRIAMKFVPYATLVLVLAAVAYHEWPYAVLILASSFIWVGDVFISLAAALDQELQARDHKLAELQRRLAKLERLEE
jgi:hypothetical protein